MDDMTQPPPVPSLPPSLTPSLTHSFVADDLLDGFLFVLPLLVEEARDVRSGQRGLKLPELRLGDGGLGKTAYAAVLRVRSLSSTNWG